MAKKSKTKSKSKRKSKPRTSHKGLIAGLSIGGVVALIIGALVVMYFMGVFDGVFKKKSKPRVNNDKSKSTMNLVNVPGFISGQTDKTQSVLLGSGRRSMLDTFETMHDSELYESLIKQLNRQSYFELNKGKDGRYFIRGFGVNADSSIEVRNVVLDKNILKFELLLNKEENKWITFKFTSNPNKATLNGVGTVISEYVYYPDKGKVIVYLQDKDNNILHPYMTISDTVFK